MIIFHEGLPRSGKSYEALVSHIVPSIEKGRKVFARINGLNYEKIAEITNKTVEEVQQLLIHIPEEKVLDIHEHVENDSMVIIDELQNFFPTGRQKLSEGITKFVTEHGHRGLDIVCMGQSIADCHNLWRRRTQRKIQFIKLDMVGSENRYKWTAYQGALNGKGDIQFTKIKSATAKYNPKYFGAYASHEAGTDNKGNYEDDRLNIFKTKTFTVFIPLFLIICIYAVYWLFTFFDPEENQVNEPEVVQKTPVLTAQKLPPLPGQNTQNQKLKNVEHGFDFLPILNSSYDSKITYLDQRRGIVWDMIVIWFDNTGKVIDRMYLSDFKSLGFSVQYFNHGVVIEKEDYKALFRFRPDFEPAYSISQAHREQLQTDF